jgi:glyoxylase-like metal-dependent hydrolase (beta-lactamase superfamily II)
MPKKIAENIWKINADSNLYLLLFDKKIVIDTCPKSYRSEVKREISEIIPPDKIDAVIFTHLHYDHAGNYGLFKRAKLFASAGEIAFLKDDPYGAVLEDALGNEMKKLEILPLDGKEGKALLNGAGLEMIDCPGHTAGSVSLLHKKSGALFSGDTLFFHAAYGRLDLPSSVPEKMSATLRKMTELAKEKGIILCPGHDY